MPRVTSDLKNVTIFQPYPKNVYKAAIRECNLTKSQQSNPMIELRWRIIEGEFSGKDMPPEPRRFDRIVLSGTNKEGKDIIPYSLVNLIEATKIPWSCLECAADFNNGESFYRSDGTDGLDKKNIYCPKCRNTLHIAYDTNDFIGKTAIIAIDVEPPTPTFDRESNVVKGYAPAA